LKKVDTFRDKGLRAQMVERLKNRDIRNISVLKAMNEVPRHFFLDSAFLEFAYKDNAFPIGCDQTISNPYTVAFQSELLSPTSKDKILEIGTGSGYQTAVLCKMGCKVYSVERFKDLFLKAKQNLSHLNCNVNLFYGDGYLGLPHHAPFDKIIVTAGAAEVPVPLKEQLKIGGILVIPVGFRSQKMTVILKTKKDTFEVISEYTDFKFVPLLREKK
jgi:protein-L-isoaspartate(D-aspartate) O-methyltransferase